MTRSPKVKMGCYVLSGEADRIFIFTCDQKETTNTKEANGAFIRSTERKSLQEADGFVVVVVFASYFISVLLTLLVR